ncbi:DUF3320 domain-containing protein, partial [Streptomyces sp. SID5914]
YRGRAAAELRLREAVEQAVAQGPLRAPVEPPATGPGGEPPVDGTAPAGDGQEEAGTLRAVPAPRVPAQVEVEHERVPVDSGAERDWSAPYRTSRVEVSPRHELHTPEARPALRKVLAQVIEVEGPIHEDLLVQRAREAWGVGRAGNRIRDNVREVALALVRAGLVSSDGAFFDTVRRDTLKARTPQDGAPVRKVVHIAPDERYVALYELAAECPGMSQDELIKQACEFFGWRRTGKDIRDRLAADITALHQQGRFEGGPDRVGVVRA